MVWVGVCEQWGLGHFGHFGQRMMGKPRVLARAMGVRWPGLGRLGHCGQVGCDGGCSGRCPVAR